MRITSLLFVLVIIACGGGSNNESTDPCPGEQTCPGGTSCCPAGDTCCGDFCTDPGDIACVVASTGACDGFECPASEGCGPQIGTCG